jgi:hypothetical protein
MTLPRRRCPRAVYRVYTEEEYLNGAGCEPATMEVSPVITEPRGQDPDPRGQDPRERRLRRVAGAAMLAGAVGTVGALVAVDSSRARRGAGRRPGSLVAAARAPRIAHSPVVDSAPVAPSRPVAVKVSRLTRVRVARAGHSRGDLSIHLPTRLTVGRRGGGVARVRSSKGPGASPGASTVAGSSVGSASAAEGPSVGSARAATAHVGSGRPEFGFER